MTEKPTIDETVVAALRDNLTEKSDHAEVSRKTVYDIHQNNYGNSKAVVDSVTKGANGITQAAVIVTGERLCEAIKTAKEAGDDPLGLSSELRVQTPEGRTTVVAHAQKIERSPQSGDSVTREGAVRVRHKISKGVHASAADRVAEMTSAALK